MNFFVDTENGDKLGVKICFDTYGNLYFDIGHLKNDNLYFNNTNIKPLHQLNIDGRNKPFTYPGEYKIKDKSSTDIRNLKLVNNNLEKLAKDSVEYYDDDEYDLDPIPEDKYYIEEEISDNDNEIIDEEILNKYGDLNKPFNFFNEDPDYVFRVNKREEGEITSLYDTYIYIQDLLGFKSSSPFGESIYILKLNDNNQFIFRPIDGRDTSYKVLLKKDGTFNFIPINK
jgi:hypothetical protein